MKHFNGVVQIAFCLSLLFLVPGCGRGNARPRSQVHGTVKLDGKPLSEGSVRFTSIKTGESASANLNSEGHYALEFPEIDLATAYEVTVQAAFEENQDALAQMEQPTEKKKSSIPRKYADRSTSGLKAESIVAGDNEFNFDLVSK